MERPTSATANAEGRSPVGPPPPRARVTRARFGRRATDRFAPPGLNTLGAPGATAAPSRSDASATPPRQRTSAAPAPAPISILARRPATRTPVLRALSTGGPAHIAEQDAMREAATGLFPEEFRSQVMRDVFDHALIERRALARPIEWYLQPRSFADKNAVYVQEALDLSEQLATQALADAGLEAAQIDAVVFVSSTGISTPSLDAYLMQRMGISSSAARLPLWGLGCVGGAAGLARAADLVRAGYEHVLLVAVEFCSLTFQMGDADKSNFIGTALFADGGAAAVLGAAGGPDDGGLVRLVHAHSELIDDSAAITGWDVVEEGFKLRLSKEIPQMMAEHLRPIVDTSLASVGWALDELAAVVIHPGGAKVITGYEQALELAPGTLDATRDVLRAHGNMSSPTVLFALAETLRRGVTGRGLISATGPGFSTEHLLVEFP